MGCSCSSSENENPKQKFSEKTDKKFVDFEEYKSKNKKYIIQKKNKKNINNRW